MPAIPTSFANGRLRHEMAVLLSIYSRRQDLQEVYPEVRDGKLRNLVRWAAGVVERRKDADYKVLMPHAAYYTRALAKKPLAERFASLTSRYFRQRTVASSSHDLQSPDSSNETPCRPINIAALEELNESYRQHIRGLLRRYPRDKAMSLAVGDNYQSIGFLQYQLLLWQGLKPDDFIVDVGCGSGRLANALKSDFRGEYLGIDVVPELLDYARELCPNDWRFELAQDLAIPAISDSVDIVCFFSVFTHLLHEQTYRYLQEARRVLKPKGKAIFSFLEFEASTHWRAFEEMVNCNTRPYLNMFIGRDAIHCWAEHLHMSVQQIQNGKEPFIPLARPVVFNDGSRQEALGTFGQSVAVLVKSGHA